MCAVNEPETCISVAPPSAAASWSRRQSLQHSARPAITPKLTRRSANDNACVLPLRGERSAAGCAMKILRRGVCNTWPMTLLTPTRERAPWRPDEIREAASATRHTDTNERGSLELLSTRISIYSQRRRHWRSRYGMAVREGRQCNGNSGTLLVHCTLSPL